MYCTATYWLFATMKLTRDRCEIRAYDRDIYLYIYTALQQWANNDYKRSESSSIGLMLLRATHCILYLHCIAQSSNETDQILHSLIFIFIHIYSFRDADSSNPSSHNSDHPSLRCVLFLLRHKSPSQKTNMSTELRQSSKKTKQHRKKKTKKQREDTKKQKHDSMILKDLTAEKALLKKKKKLIFTAKFNCDCSRKLLLVEATIATTVTLVFYKLIVEFDMRIALVLKKGQLTYKISIMRALYQSNETMSDMDKLAIYILYIYGQNTRAVEIKYSVRKTMPES